jgi:uncharacterized protein (TIGR02246 family)
MSAEDAIRNTLAQYALNHDDRNADGYASLFLPDATFAGGGQPYVGRDAIHAFITNHYQSQPAERVTKHLCGNPRIEVEGDSATAVTDFIAYECLGDGPWEVHTIGRYHDRLQRDGDTWRFAERRIVNARRRGQH